MTLRLFALILLVTLSSLVWWPGVYQPSHFYSLATAESARAAAIFGAPVIDAIAAATESFDSLTLAFFPDRVDNTGYDQAFSAAANRALSIDYFYAMKSQVTLGLTRGLIALAWLVLLSPIVLATVLDALITRQLRARTFAPWRPLLHQTSVNSAMLILASSAAAALMPFGLAAEVAILAMAGLLICIHTATTHFHRFS